MFRGSCLCGEVAFEAEQASEFRYCHCSRCRKARGSAFAANMFAQPSDFRRLRGQNRILKYRMPNTQRYGNWFCEVCGSPVPREIDALNMILIPGGALDDDPAIRPGYHIFASSKAPWHEIGGELPQFSEYPPK